MPVPLLFSLLDGGIGSVPYAVPVLKAIPVLFLIGLLKIYFGGARNRAERKLHSKVVMITGGTSGIGACIAHELAVRGAQIILLTRDAPSDPFLVDYVNDLREATGNELIYAEQVDLSSLYSIRRFATKWVDNAPPRRLDMMVLCAATFKPRFGIQASTRDGLEASWGVNYLANFHLLSILSPALRAQPPDRDVRVLFANCSSYLGGDLDKIEDSKSPLPRGKERATSKLALMVFASAFQKTLDSYKRPDGAPNNTRIAVVDPGLCRTPGMRRWLSMGSLWGLLGYMIIWPVWWLVLKSPIQGAQTFLLAAMEVELGRGEGGRFFKECKEIRFARKEVGDEVVAKRLWEFSEKQITELEREDAKRRAVAKNIEELEAKNDGIEKRGTVVDSAASKQQRRRKAG